ncbi:MAG: hypothetical protein WC756_04970 [Taibaiella sp.]|jgi:hypothetical protein
MLSNIVNLISSSECETHDGSIFCRNYKIADEECLTYLYDNSILNDLPSSTTLGEIVDLELSLVRLNSVGYYENCEAFVAKNPYESPTSSFYIDELKSYSDGSNNFIIQYDAVIHFIDSFKSKKISSFVFSDTDGDHCIVVSEQKSLLIPISYSANIVKEITPTALNEFSIIFNEEKSEKHLIFINEMLTALDQVKENRFEWLLSNFDKFLEKYKNAYQFYLSKFSYNKLKIELDSKALEFTQKVQSVINESQTKLIAIPAAFTLSIATFDFKEINDVKNFATIPGLLIFAILIQLFINNQKSTLKFIRENIASYKDIFRSANEKVDNIHQLSIEQVSTKFALMEKELRIQKGRLKITEAILWTLPVILLITWCLLLCYNFFSSGLQAATLLRLLVTIITML